MRSNHVHDASISWERTPSLTIARLTNTICEENGHWPVKLESSCRVGLQIVLSIYWADSSHKPTGISCRLKKGKVCQMYAWLSSLYSSQARWFTPVRSHDSVCEGSSRTPTHTNTSIQSLMSLNLPLQAFAIKRATAKPGVNEHHHDNTHRIPSNRWTCKVLTSCVIGWSIHLWSCINYWCAWTLCELTAPSPPVFSSP